MQTYRINAYAPNGRLLEARDIVCVDDAEALLRARPLGGTDRDVEIWDGTRRVKRPDGHA